jgi:hypothetical protein
VYHGEWGGTEVAVKVLLKKDDIPDNELENFSKEIKLMRYHHEVFMQLHVYRALDLHYIMYASS